MLSRPAGLTCALVVVALSLGARPGMAQRVERPTRVLVLYQQQAETQPMLDFTQHLRPAVREALGSRVEFYQEALDFDRFTGREHSPPLAGYFADKYRGFGIDVVVPIGSRALQFAIDRMSDVLPNIPVVFALCAAPQTNPSELPAQVTGRLAPASRFTPTIAMARSLQPDAERIVVLGGAGAADSASVSAVVRAAATPHDSLPLTVLQGLPLNALLSRLRQLPRRSIVIFANYRQDGQGEAFEPLDIVGSIARASSAPVYTQLRSYVGEGVVGGSVTRFDDEGVLTGRLVARVLRRRPGEPMPPVESIANVFVADSRQLRRWALPQSRLPARTELLFREPSPWERYWSVVLLTLAVMSAEWLLIGRLLVERRQRRRAQALAEEQQQRAEETLRQVTHMGRVALVGELAATMSHELRQPLSAIRANAEVGVKLTTRATEDFGAEERELCRDIFADIVRDDDHAADIVTRVRALLRREELPRAPVDLNETCRAAARLLQYDAQRRRAQIVLLPDPRSPMAIADAVQLQQVVLNLAVNALEASMSSTRPQVVIRTVTSGEDVEIVVEDNGPGLPPHVQQRLFEAFFTTKPQGLGLGLVVVQSIVERHQGRVHAENREAGGATFRVVLPRARPAPIHARDATPNPLEAERPAPASVPPA